MKFNWKKLFHKEMEYKQDLFIRDISKLGSDKSCDHVTEISTGTKTIKFLVFRNKFKMIASYSLTDKTYSFKIEHNRRNLIGHRISGLPCEYSTGGDIARTAFNQLFRMSSYILEHSTIAQDYLIHTITRRNADVTHPNPWEYAIDEKYMVHARQIDTDTFQTTMRAEPAGAPIPRDLVSTDTDFAHRMYMTLQQMYKSQRAQNVK